MGATDFNERQKNAFSPEGISLWKRELSCVTATAGKYFAASSDAPLESRGSSRKPRPLQCLGCDIWCFVCHRGFFSFVAHIQIVLHIAAEPLISPLPKSWSVICQTPQVTRNHLAKEMSERVSWGFSKGLKMLQKEEWSKGTHLKKDVTVYSEAQ